LELRKVILNGEIIRWVQSSYAQSWLPFITRNYIINYFYFKFKNLNATQRFAGTIYMMVYDHFLIFFFMKWVYDEARTGRSLNFNLENHIYNTIADMLLLDPIPTQNCCCLPFIPVIREKKKKKWKKEIFCSGWFWLVVSWTLYFFPQQWRESKPSD